MTEEELIQRPAVQRIVGNVLASRKRYVDSLSVHDLRGVLCHEGCYGVWKDQFVRGNLDLPEFEALVSLQLQYERLPA